ncbi:MAG TPA: hypothetical protein VF184_10755 [Phycisphaeraceae bacterium]
MRIARHLIVPLGYGKYFRSDSIVGLQPVEEGRGPGKRTQVYIQDLPHPIIASRSEGAILRDLVQSPQEVTRAQEQRELLTDILDTIEELNPVLRSIIRDQAKWDLDRLEERIREALGQDEAT